MEFKEWPFQEAKKIIERAKAQNKSKILLETGYGPSGLPHIGTFGEVARTTFVMQALNELAPDIKTELIAFSDDMDGLRNIPSNIPNQTLLKEHLGKPLTMVPDPFEKYPSFADYMNNQLKKFLDSFKFEYSFKSSTAIYKSGLFNEGLKKVMDNKDELIKLFVSTIRKEKRANWSPFFPICAKCHKIYSTRVTDYDPINYSVSYCCDQDEPNQSVGCRHQATSSIFDGNVKVGWKIDWALRWHSFKIDYEMHGEDLTESGRLSSKIAMLLGEPAPLLFKYELFLDETGQKISKKIGNGLSIDQWLSYGPYDSLLYFMYDKPQKPKKMGLPIFPKIVDSYLTTIDEYNFTDKDHPAFFIIRQTDNFHASKSSNEKQVITYSLIYNLIIALAEPDPELIINYLLKYQPAISENLEYYRALVTKGIAYYNQFFLSNKVDQHPDSEFADLTSLFKDRLAKSGENHDGQYLQNLAYEIAKEHDVPLKSWFQHLYKLLLKQSSGPKIGSFIKLLGKEKTIERLNQYLAQHRKSD